jgi:hypothetical protein
MTSGEETFRWFRVRLREGSLPGYEVIVGPGGGVTVRPMRLIYVLSFGLMLLVGRKFATNSQDASVKVVTGRFTTDLQFIPSDLAGAACTLVAEHPRQARDLVAALRRVGFSVEGEPSA